MATARDPDAAPWTPARPTLLALLPLSVWAVVLFLPMFGGQFLGGDFSDQTWTGIPFRSFWADEVRRTGAIPLWNPFMFGGLPFVGAMHGDIFYPTSFLRLLVGADQGLNATFFIHLVLAGVLTYGFLRTLGTSWTAAVVGGLAYQLSGIVASQVSPGHDGKMIVSALLPLLLTGLLLAIRRRRSEGYGLVALVIGLDILSPQVQMAQYSLIFAGLFTLYLCFYDEERPEGRARWTALGLASLAVVLGFGLSMIQIYPFIANGPYAARTAGVQGWEYATSYAMPAVNIMDWLVATFTGSSVWGVYWGGAWGKLHSEYLGAATLALAAVGVAASGRRRLAWFLAGAFVLFLLVCLGAQTPFYRLWYTLVPGVKVTRAPGMAFFIPTFIVACFAAFGVERLERGEGSRVLRGVLVGAGLLLLLGISGGMVKVAEALAGERAVAIERIAGAISLGTVLAGLAAGAAAATGFALTTGRLRALGAAAALAAVVSGDLFINARRYFTWSPGAAELFAPDSVIAHLRSTPLPYRAVDLPLGEGGTTYPTAFLMYERIPNVLGHHGNELHAYDQLLGGKNVWANLNSTRLFDLLAVRYVILPVPVRVGGYHVVARTSSVAGSRGRPAAAEAILYEADSAPAYARVVPGAFKVPAEQIVPALMDPRLDYNRLVLLPEDAPLDVPRIDSMPPAMAARATVSSWAPGRISLRLDPAPEHDAFLVVAENWYPDWHATVDGREAAVLRGQQTLITVPVPRGARDVELTFRSRSYRLGRAMSLVSLTLILPWLVVPVARRRRRG